MPLSFLGYPDDTGMRQKFSPQKRGGDFPYDDEGVDGDGWTVDIHGQNHNALTPKDTAHTVWDDALDEIEGYPAMLSRSSPGQMTNVTPGGAKFGGDPFDHEVDQDELEKDGKVSEDVGDGSTGMASPPNDEEIRKHGEEDEITDPASPRPSDIFIVGQSTDFMTGLGNAYQDRGGLFGIQDSNDRGFVKKSAWAYLEQLLNKR